MSLTAFKVAVVPHSAEVSHKRMKPLVPLVPQTGEVPHTGDGPHMANQCFTITNVPQTPDALHTTAEVPRSLERPLMTIFSTEALFLVFFRGWPHVGVSVHCTITSTGRPGPADFKFWEIFAGFKPACSELRPTPQSSAACTAIEVNLAEMVRFLNIPLPFWALPKSCANADVKATRAPEEMFFGFYKLCSIRDRRKEPACHLARALRQSVSQSRLSIMRYLRRVSSGSGCCRGEWARLAALDARHVRQSWSDSKFNCGLDELLGTAPVGFCGPAWPSV